MANIVILSDVRTGSSLVCEAFECFKNTSTLHDLFWYNGQVIYDMDTNKFPENLRGFLDEEKNKLKEIIKTKRDIFNNDNVSRLLGNANGDVTIGRYLHAHPLEFFESVITACSPNHVVFKTHLYTWKVTDLDWLFDLSNTYFIVLDRKSRLAQYTSLAIANKTKKWSRYNTSTERVSVNPMEFQEFKRFTDRGYNHFYINQLKKQNIKPFNVYYEDDLENIEPELFLKRIQIWMESNGVILERNDSVFPKRMVKQNSTPLAAQITNYNEVIQFIQNEPKIT
jgi:LPS sulfotransferase NodH